MISEIMAGLYRVEIPLPKNPLKSLNSYFIKGKKRNLIVDTGFNRPECQEALFKGVRELEMDLEKTDIFITHLHADHSGLATKLMTKGTRVYSSKTDARAINDSLRYESWLEVGRFMERYGFILGISKEALVKHPARKYCPDHEIDFTLVQEKDVISLGNFDFRCIETPGHTPGHICLYEPGRKVLLAGDHILGDITPNIAMWEEMIDPLGEYLQSLNKILDMDIDLVLPAHRGMIDNWRARIEELKHHHAVRLQEVLEILQDGPQNGYDVAARMTWDIKASSWDHYPIPQKWFATGEAVSHLEHLVRTGQVRKIMDQDKIYFSLV